MPTEFMTGYSILIGYFAVCASAALVLRKFVQMPTEVFRKTLHFILLGSIFVLIYAFRTWWVSALAAIAFPVMIYPILRFAERFKGYPELLTERKDGEIKSSLVIVFGMFAALISVCWGLLNAPYLVIASVFAWGLGDAAAALVGKRFGKRYLEGKLIEGRKTLEGTFAMFVVSFFAVLVILLMNGPVVWYGYVPIAALTAVGCSVVELYTKGGLDTLTCPFTAAAIMIPLVHLWGV